MPYILHRLAPGSYDLLLEGGVVGSVVRDVTDSGYVRGWRAELMSGEPPLAGPFTQNTHEFKTLDAAAACPVRLMAGTRERLTPDERERRQRFLRYVGEAVFGSSWQAAMARAMGAAIESTVTRSRVAQWASGSKPMPSWALEAAVRVALDSAARMRASADALETAASLAGRTA